MTGDYILNGRVIQDRKGFDQMCDYVKTAALKKNAEIAERRRKAFEKLEERNSRQRAELEEVVGHQENVSVADALRPTRKTSGIIYAVDEKAEAEYKPVRKGDSVVYNITKEAVRAARKAGNGLQAVLAVSKRIKEKQLQYGGTNVVYDLAAIEEVVKGHGQNVEKMLSVIPGYIQYAKTREEAAVNEEALPPKERSGNRIRVPTNRGHMGIITTKKAPKPRVEELVVEDATGTKIELDLEQEEQNWFDEGENEEYLTRKGLEDGVVGEVRKGLFCRAKKYVLGGVVALATGALIVAGLSSLGSSREPEHDQKAQTIETMIVDSLAHPDVPSRIPSVDLKVKEPSYQPRAVEAPSAVTPNGQGTLDQYVESRIDLAPIIVMAEPRDDSTRSRSGKPKKQNPRVRVSKECLETDVYDSYGGLVNCSSSIPEMKSFIQRRQEEKNAASAASEEATNPDDEVKRSLLGGYWKRFKNGFVRYFGR